jgi:hypothetical protein
MFSVQKLAVFAIIIAALWDAWDDAPPLPTHG